MDSMEEDNVLLCCRTCLCIENETTKKTKESFQSILIMNLKDIFQSLTNINLSQTDGLSTKICKKCTDKLWQFNEFKLQCIQSDKVLKQRISSLAIKGSNDVNNIARVDKKTTDIGEKVKLELDPLEYEWVGTEFIKLEMNITDGDDLNGDNDDDDDDKNPDKDADDKIHKVKTTENVSNKDVTDNTIIPQKIDSLSDKKKDIDVMNNKEAVKCLAKKSLIRNSFLSKRIEAKKKKSSRARQNFPYVCDECGAGFLYQERFEGHLREHEGKKAAVCEFCGSEYTGWSYLRIHMEREHKDDIKYKCHCGKAFAYESGLIAHKVTHERPSYICEECGKSFYDTYQLNKHSLTHKTETPFECDQCGKKFKAEYRLRNHQFRHKNIRDFKCNTCEKAFITGSELRVHFRSHSDVFNFDCKICGKRFRHKSQVNVHMRTHNIEFTYP